MTCEKGFVSLGAGGSRADATAPTTHLVKSEELDVALDLDVATAGADQPDDRLECLGLRRRLGRQPARAVCIARRRALVRLWRVINADDEALGVVEDELIALADEAEPKIKLSAGSADCRKGDQD